MQAWVFVGLDRVGEKSVVLAQQAATPNILKDIPQG